MKKTILITGSTDGIGLIAAQMLAKAGHRVLLHGRSANKLDAAKQALLEVSANAEVDTFLCDLSRLADVAAFAKAITDKYATLDILINNAGIISDDTHNTPDGLNINFAVNTYAPYLLSNMLLPVIPQDGRIVNLSSAAQSPVNTAALLGDMSMSSNAAYAQSKLALNMWSKHMADEMGERGPAIIAVNPKSLLGTKMVKNAFGIAGSDIRVGGQVIVDAALSDKFATASGEYFDNDIGRFARQHPDVFNTQKRDALVTSLDRVINSVMM